METLQDVKQEMELVTSLKSRIDSLEKILDRYSKQLAQIVDNLSADGWYSSTFDKSDILSELCDILEHEAKGEVIISATVQVEVRYDCPLSELEDFDAEDFLRDGLSIDTYNGDSIVEGYEVEHADWRTL